MASGHWKLTANRRGYETAELNRLDPAQQRTVTLVMTKLPTGSIVGTLTGAGEPQPNHIWASSSAHRREMDDTLVADDGSYRIDDFPAGLVKVTATVYSYSEPGSREQSKHANLPPGGQVRVDFEFAPEFEIIGRVTRDGQPVFGVSLGFSSDLAGSKRGQTDVNGDYTVQLQGGSYRVNVRPLDRGAQSHRLDVDGPAVFDIELGGVAVVGQTVDKVTGEAVAGVELSIGEIGDWSFVENSTVRTGKTGFFLFENLNPARHLLKAVHPDHVQWRQVLELGEGEPGEVLVRLEKAAGIKVILVDARTSAQLSGTVVAHDMANTLVFDGKPQPEGLAVRLPLSPGMYRVSASASGYATRTVEVSAPCDDVVIPLTPGGSLAIRSNHPRSRMAKLVMPSGHEYIRCWCNSIAEFWLKGDLTVFDNIAAGSYTFVVFESGQATSAHPVIIVEGQRTELSIQ